MLQSKTKASRPKSRPDFETVNT